MADSFSNGYALLIGAGRDNDLPMAITDAKALHNLLTDSKKAAYPDNQAHMIFEKDANSKNILAHFDKLIEQVNKDDNSTVLIYYSGHGGFIKNDNEKKYYLFPFGYDVNDTSTLVSADDLVAKVDALNTKKLIILLDCCFAAGMLTDDDEPVEGMEAKGDDSKIENVTSPLIQKMAGGEGRVIVASCQDDQVSWGKTPHSVFTESMLEAMTGVNSSPFSNTVHVLDILQHTFSQVPHRTRKTRQAQKPVVNEIKNLTADFYICLYDGNAANEMRSKGIGNQETAIQKPEEKMKDVEKHFITINQTVNQNITDNSQTTESNLRTEGQTGGTNIGHVGTLIIQSDGSVKTKAGGPSKDDGKASASGVTTQNLRKTFINSSDRKIEKILDALIEMTFADYPDFNNDAIMLKNSYSRWKADEMIMTSEQKTLGWNRISHRFLTLLDDIESDDDDLF